MITTINLQYGAYIMSGENDTNDENNKTPLEETFDIPSIKEINGTVTNSSDTDSDDQEDDSEQLDENYFDSFENLSPEDVNSVKDQLKKTKKQLQQIKDYEYQNQKIKEYDKDVKDIHTKAIDNFEEIMSTALNMEASQGSKYLTAATKLLDIALDAKNSSFDRHMEMAKLQFQKEKEDNKQDPRVVHGTDNDEEEHESPEDVVGTFNRNDILYGSNEENNNDSDESNDEDSS